MNDTGNNEFGSITLNATSGAYSFTADADKIDALNAGQNITVSYDAVVTDEHGAHATRSLEFTLFGAKDTAEMSGATTVNVTEDSTTMSAGGTLTVTDRDSGESAFKLSDLDLTGTHGDFTFNDEGEWTYTLNNSAQIVQNLTAASATVFDSLIIFSLDGSASQTITVGIHGADEGGSTTGIVDGEPLEFMVNNGLSIVNGRASFLNFDGNDVLVYSDNFDCSGIILDGPDGDTTSFSFTTGNDNDNGNGNGNGSVGTTEYVTVTLVGFHDLALTDVVPA